LYVKMKGGVQFISTLHFVMPGKGMYDDMESLLQEGYKVN